MSDAIIETSGTATQPAPMAFQSSNAASPARDSGTSPVLIGASVPPLRFDGRTFRVVEGDLFVLSADSPPPSPRR